MPEVLHTYRQRVSRDHTDYLVRACGREADDGRWEGWLEFQPDDGGAVLRSERESTQPNRTDLEYWSSGLGPAYLEGALQRTLEPRRPVREAPPGEPAYPGPAPAPSQRAEAVLDPLAVYAQHGPARLRAQLGALGAPHLRRIARAYELLDVHQLDLDALPAEELAERILEEVAARRPAAGAPA